MNDNPQEKPKLIIDEDWKTQVEEDRARLKNEDGDQPQPASDEMHRAELPAASFPLLITTLATQAMAALGQIPDPLEKKPVLNLDLAKHHIDMLAVLEEKTRGNLDNNDAQMLESVLHQLRMVFVAIRQQAEGRPGDASHGGMSD